MLRCMAVRHFVLTRFNTRIPGSERGLDADWLAHRLSLFEAICGPAIARQSVQPTRWLVFFDARTPDGVRAQVDRLAERFRFDPVWLPGEFTTAAASAAVRDRLDDATAVITTRLDNDDAIHPDFIGWVQAKIGERPSYVNFPLGCQLVDGHFYLRPYLGSPFLSRLELVAEGITTVHAARHWRPDEHRARQVWTRDPAWLQLVHGKNLANETRGVWARPDRLVALFEVPPAYVSTERVSPRRAVERRLRSVATLAPAADVRRRAAAVRAMLRR